MSSGSPTQAPTAAELLADVTVQQALQQAWLDSQPANSAQRHEEGGWIYVDLGSGQIEVRRAAAGQRARISLASPPLVPNAVLVGTFHTHPNPTAEGWNPGPSTTDQAAAAFSGVPWLIRSDSGDFSTGPTRRRGGLAAGPGFPP